MRTSITPPLLLALALALALAACRDGSTGAAPDSTPPLLEVLAPGANAVLPPGPVRLRARCREDHPGGCTVEAFLQGARVAQGRDSLDATVSLAEYRDQAVSFTFVATSTGGAAAATETRGFRVTRAPALEVLSPLDSTAPANPIRLRARCATDAPGGCSVKVFLKGAATALAFDVDSIDARVPLPEQQGKAVRFVFVASDTSGARTTMETGEMVLPAITQPWIEVLSPAPAGTAALADPTRVRARCRGFSQRCWLQVKVGDVVVAEGVDSVNAPVVLAGYAGEKVRFTFVGRSIGLSSPPPPTTAETREFPVLPSAWKVALAAPGRLHDATPRRAVYSLPEWDELRLLEVPTGSDRVLYRESDAEYAEAAVTDDVVLILYAHRAEGKRQGTEEFGGSNARTGGYRITARGRWAVWLDGSSIFRDDAPAATLTHTPNFYAYDSPGSGYDLAEDGTIVYTGWPADYAGWPAVGETDLYLFRGGAAERITNDSASIPMSPRTDGANVVYTRRTSTSSGFRYQLVLLPAAGGEVTLSEPLAAAPQAIYRAEGGWVVYTLPDGGATQLWARSPAGQVQRVTPWGTGSILRGVGPDGQVLVESGGRLYFAATAHEALVDVGLAHQGPVRWFDGRAHLVVGYQLLRLDP